MRKTVVALSLGLGLALGYIFMTPAVNIAKAGFEPSPFQPEINQLGAVANILHSADFRVANSIAHPPDPCVPPDPCNSPDLNGAVNRLAAISDQLSSADDMVSAINEVMGVEPSPFRKDVIPALEVVRDAAGMIDGRVDAFIRVEPPLPLTYLDALGWVGHKASDVFVTAQSGINEISSSLCATNETQADCEAAECLWIEPHSGPAYCDIVGY
jgi:hypothetical protein